MSIYTPQNPWKTQKLIEEIFLAVPELIKIIAPNGLANSPYAYTQKYTWFEEDLAGRVKVRYMTKKPLKDILFPVRATLLPKDRPWDIYRKLIVCLDHIFGYNCVVHDNRLRSYTCGPSSQRWNFILNSLRMTGQISQAYVDEFHVFVTGIYAGGEDVDIQVFYEFIFQKLKNHGMDWEYRCFEFIWMNYHSFKYPQEKELDKRREEEAPGDLITMEKDIEDVFIKIVLDDAAAAEFVDYSKDYDEPMVRDAHGNLVHAQDQDYIRYPFEVPDSYVFGSEYQTEEFYYEFYRVRNLPAPGALKVKAYQKVYGTLPQGYPLAEHDYAFG